MISFLCSSYFISFRLIIDDHWLNNHENVYAGGGKALGREDGLAVLENDGYTVVSDEPLSLNEMSAFLQVRQKRRHVEHDLRAFVRLVDRF